MAKHLVLVAGNIGAGKTTLTERIGARLGWWTGYESVTDNPYLSDFYGDMHAWSMPSIKPSLETVPAEFNLPITK